MTVKPLTLNERYQVWANVQDGPRHLLINTYSDRNVALKCRQILMRGLPAEYITDAWITQTPD